MVSSPDKSIFSPPICAESSGARTGGSLITISLNISSNVYTYSTKTDQHTATWVHEDHTQVVAFSISFCIYPSIGNPNFEALAMHTNTLFVLKTV